MRVRVGRKGWRTSRWPGARVAAGERRERGGPTSRRFLSSPLALPLPRAELGSDGSIIFEGYIFKSPSAFSVYVKRKQVRQAGRGCGAGAARLGAARGGGGGGGAPLGVLFFRRPPPDHASGGAGWARFCGAQAAAAK